MNHGLTNPAGPDGWHNIIVLTAHCFEEGLEAVMAVRDHHTVLLNLSCMSPELAQRTTDFVCGGVHALDGHQQRVGKNVFLLAPMTVRLERLEL